MMQKERIQLRINGETCEFWVEPNTLLINLLRNEMALTGTKYGCGAGFCGSCTVVVDGEAVRSCLTDLASVQGKRVTTIEGLATNGRLHPLQQAFYEMGGFQCGYCTPGMIMNAYALLLERPNPTREQIVQGMERDRVVENDILARVRSVIVGLAVFLDRCGQLRFVENPDFGEAFRREPLVDQLVDLRRRVVGLVVTEFSNLTQSLFANQREIDC